MKKIWRMTICILSEIYTICIVCKIGRLFFLPTEEQYYLNKPICLLGKQLIFAWIILSAHCFPNILSLFGPPCPEIEEQLRLALASDHAGWLKVKAASRKVHNVTDYTDNPPESSKQRGRFDKRTSTQKTLKDNLVDLTVQSKCDPLLHQQLFGQLNIFQKRLTGHFPE